MNLKKLTLPIAALAVTLVPTLASADSYGSTDSYSRIESDKMSLVQSFVNKSDDMESTAVEASEQAYVALSNYHSSVSFKASREFNAMNIRFTVPDGQTGKLSVKVNGQIVKTLELSSQSSWQYLSGDKASNDANNGSHARFRFDETYFVLNQTVHNGDTIELVNESGTQVGLDFVELETAPEPIKQPANSVSITDFGARPNDGQDDSDALFAAVYQAKQTGKSVYIPEGEFTFNRKIWLEANDLKITGAGMWHTKLYFTSDAQGGGGFEFGHNSNRIELSNLSMDSNLKSRYDERANYKAIAGTLGKDSKISNVWIQHFECGLWIGDYTDAQNMKYTDHLVVENARIRNNLADGVNFAQGTKNSVVKNSNIRGNGDDGLATWASISDGTESAIAENNKFVYNTIELGWRAGGVGIFGGRGHEVAYNKIQDNFANAGIRVSTVFAGHNFDLNNSGINIHDNYLYRTGTMSDLYGQKRGAFDFERQRGDLKNINVTNNKVQYSFATDKTDNENLVNYINNNVSNEPAKTVSDNKPRNSFVDEGGYYVYYNNSGNKVTGFNTIDGINYYFYNDGRQAKGDLIKVDSDYYYTTSDIGRVVTNEFKEINGSWYFFGKDGKALKGFKTVDHLNYYFHTDGKQSKGETFNINGHTYTTDANTGVVTKK